MEARYCLIRCASQRTLLACPLAAPTNLARARVRGEGEGEGEGEGWGLRGPIGRFDAHPRVGWRGGDQVERGGRDVDAQQHARAAKV